MEERHGVEELVGLGEVGDGDELADVSEEIAVGELDAFGDAFGAAGEEDDGGAVDLLLRGELGPCGVGERAEGGGEKGGEFGGEFGGCGDGGADVFEEDEGETGVGERGEVDAGFFEEGAGGDDLGEAGGAGAGEHLGGACGEVEEGGFAAEGPEGEEGGWGGVDVGEEEAGAWRGGVELGGQLGGKETCAEDEAFAGDGSVRVFEGAGVAVGAGGGGDGGGEIAGALVEFGLEAEVERAGVEPFHEAGALACGAFAGEFRGLERFAEVSGDLREELFAIGVGGEWDAVGAAEVAEDDAGFGFEEEEAGAVIEAHERAGGGETAFREEGETAAFLQEFGHVFDRVG